MVKHVRQRRILWGRSFGVMSALHLAGIQAAQADEGQKDAVDLHSLIDCFDVARPVVVGKIPMAFVVDQGQHGGAVDAQGIALEAGNIFFDAEGLRFSLNEVERPEHAPAAIAQLRFVGTTPLFAPNKQDLAPTVVSYLDGAAAGFAGLSSYSAIEAPELYPAISARFQGTTRVLDSVYRVDPGSTPDTLRWLIDGSSTPTIDEQTGILNLGVPSIHDTSLYRMLEMSPPVAWQEREDGTHRPVDARFVLDRDAMGVQVGDYDARSPLFFQLQVQFAPFLPNRGIAEYAGLSVIAGGTSQEFADNAQRDVFLAAIDQQSGGLEWVTFVRSEGDELARALSISSRGDIAIVGRNSLATLPIETHLLEPRGEVNSFMLHLDGSGTKVMQGAYLGYAGAESIAWNAAGGLLVGGRPGSDFQALSSSVRYSAIFPKPKDEAAPSTYFIAGTDAEWQSLDFSQPHSAGDVAEITVWHDCQGKPVIGIPPTSATAGCGGYPDLVHTMRQYSQNYDIDHDWGNFPYGSGSAPGGWGFHALRWRYYDVNDPTSPNYAGPHTLTWSLAPTSGTYVPYDQLPACPHEVDLDLLEASAMFSPGNPPGAWACGNHTSAAQLGFMAAYYAYRYGSATYTRFDDSPGPYYSGNYPVAVEKTIFTPYCWGSSYAGEDLQDLCDFTSGTFAAMTTSCNIAPDGGTVLGPDFQLELASIEVAKWGAMTWYLRHITFDTSDLYWYVSAPYVVDPPEEESLAIREVEEVGHQLEAVAVGAGIVLTEIMEGDKVVSSSSSEEILPLSKLFR